MAIEVIDKIKPANNQKFKIADATDINWNIDSNEQLIMPLSNMYGFSSLPNKSLDDVIKDALDRPEDEVLKRAELTLSSFAPTFTSEQINELSAKNALPNTYIQVDKFFAEDLTNIPTVSDQGLYINPGKNESYLDILFAAIRSLQAEVTKLRNTMKYGIYSYVDPDTGETIETTIKVDNYRNISTDHETYVFIPEKFALSTEVFDESFNFNIFLPPRFTLKTTITDDNIIVNESQHSIDYYIMFNTSINKNATSLKNALPNYGPYRMFRLAYNAINYGDPDVEKNPLYKSLVDNQYSDIDTAQCDIENINYKLIGSIEKTTDNSGLQHYYISDGFKLTEFTKLQYEQLIPLYLSRVLTGQLFNVNETLTDIMNKLSQNYPLMNITTLGSFINRYLIIPFSTSDVGFKKIFKPQPLSDGGLNIGLLRRIHINSLNELSPGQLIYESNISTLSRKYGCAVIKDSLTLSGRIRKIKYNNES